MICNWIKRTRANCLSLARSLAFNDQSDNSIRVAYKGSISWLFSQLSSPGRMRTAVQLLHTTAIKRQHNSMRERKTTLAQARAQKSFLRAPLRLSLTDYANERNFNQLNVLNENICIDLRAQEQWYTLARTIGANGSKRALCWDQNRSIRWERPRLSHRCHTFD